jgi:DegV family protein with EDD domain
MKKIAVLTDSGSGLSIEKGRELGIYVIPLQVMIDNQAYDDGITMTTAQLIEQLKQKKVPKTSTPTFASILRKFDEIVDDGYDAIIAIPLSRSLSSTFDYLVQAGQEKGVDLTVIEIHTTMFLQKHVAKWVKSLVDQGLDVQQIIETIEPSLTSAYSMILPGDLEHLKAGGRLTPTAASLATLLKIRPILHLGFTTKGKVDVYDKVRTDKKALDVAIKALKKHFKNDEVFVYVGHTDAYDKAILVKDELIRYGFAESSIVIEDIVAVIASHTGLNCVGIQMIKQ